MKKLGLILGLAILAAPGLFVTSAQAQATRTWVSGVGDDVNPCSRTAPCKTFPGAISKTAAGGEIDTLDPGGFGGVTINKALTIANEGIGEAGVLVSGTNGITVGAGASDVVVIRGLQIDGGPASGTPSLAGIKFASGKALEVQNCIIRNFIAGTPNGYGISFTPNSAAQLDVSDTTISTNGLQGAGAGTGAGILIAPAAGGSAKVTVVRSNLYNNSNGIRMDNTNAVAASTLAIRDTTITNSSTHGLAVVNPSTGTPFKDIATVDHSTISGNAGDGAVANGVNSTINLTNTVVTGNGTGVLTNNSGVVNSYKTNEITGNGNDNTAALTLVTQN